MLQNPPDDICTLKDLQTHIQKVRSLSKCPSFLSTFKKQRFSFEGDDKISTGDMLIYIIGLAIVKNNREYKRELLGLLVGVPGTSKSTFLTLREEYPRLWDLSPRLLILKKITDDSIWQMRVAFRRIKSLQKNWQRSKSNSSLFTLGAIDDTILNSYDTHLYHLLYSTNPIIWRYSIDSPKNIVGGPNSTLHSSLLFGAEAIYYDFLNILTLHF